MQSTRAWGQRLAALFPAYMDLLQPVHLGVLELCTGLSVMQHAAAAAHHSRDWAALTTGLAALMTPAELTPGGSSMLQAPMAICCESELRRCKDCPGLHR